MPSGVYIRTEKIKQALCVPRKGAGIYLRNEKHCLALSKRIITNETKNKISQKLLGRKLSDETKRKMSECVKIRMTSKEYVEKFKKSLKRGENHPFWIKDRTQLAKKQERNDMAYKEWRMNVWKRDGFKCKIENDDCDGSIEAHHILSWKDYPELRYQPNNGITLCHAHHPRKRAEEKRLSPYFQELVSESKV